MKTQKSITAAAVLLAAAFATTFSPGQTRAGELNAEQQQTILREAHELYERAAANADDRALAKESYSAAAAKYQTLVDDGVRNWRLYFNLGNAYLQSGALGPAIVNYERAAALTGDKAVHANLAHAKSLVKVDKPVTEPQTLWEAAEQRLNAIPAEMLLLAAAAGWGCFWLALCVTRVEWRGRAKAIGLVAAGVFLASTIVMVNQKTESQQPIGVVLKNHAVLRSGNGSAFQVKDGEPLVEGAEVRVVERRGDWLHVKLDDGRNGWLSEQDVEVI